MTRSVVGIILTKVVGFIIFLLVLAVVNVLVPYVDNEVYTSVVVFFTENILLLAALMLVGAINDILWIFYLPVNLLAPISGAIFGVLIATFVYRFWIFVDVYINSGIVLPIKAIYVVVFIATLLFGYLTILVRGGRPSYQYEQEWKARWEKKAELAQQKVKRDVDWGDIGSEFKLAFYNLGRRFNRALERKDTKDKK